MSDTHGAQAPDSSPEQHRETARRHHRLRNTMFFLAGCVAVFAVWFFWAPIQTTAQRGASFIVANRPTAPASIAAAEKPLAVTTQAATTDTGRAGYLKTTQVFVDPVAEMESMRQQLADATKSMQDAVEQVKKQANEKIASLESQIAAKPAAAKLELDSKTSAFIKKMTKRYESPVSADSGPKAQVQDRDEEMPRHVASGRPIVHFDRSGIPANWEIRRIGDRDAAERCRGTLYVKRKVRLPDGGIRNFFGCR